VAVASAADAEPMDFGPFDEVLETEDCFGDEGPFGRVEDALTPVLELFVGVYLVGVSLGNCSSRFVRECEKAQSDEVPGNP